MFRKLWTIAAALLLVVTTGNRYGVAAKRIGNRHRNGKLNKQSRVLQKVGKGSKASCEDTAPTAVYTVTEIDGSVFCTDIPGFGFVGKTVDLFDASGDSVVGSLEYCIESAIFVFAKITTTHDQLFVMFLHDPADGRMMTQLLGPMMWGGRKLERGMMGGRKLEHDDDDDDYYDGEEFPNFGIPEILPVKGSAETLGGRISMEGVLYDWPEMYRDHGMPSRTMNPSSSGSYKCTPGDDCYYDDDDDDDDYYSDDYNGFGYKKADLTFSFYGQLPEVEGDDDDYASTYPVPVAPPTTAPTPTYPMAPAPSATP